MSPGNEERRGPTVADLLALVAGVAIAATLPWDYWIHPYDFRGPWPGWLPYVWAARQVAGICCLVLIPVILVRRFQFGGLVRPAEFVGATVGLPHVLAGLKGLAFLAWLRDRGLKVASLRDPIPVQFLSDWHEGPGITVNYAIIAAAAVALVGFLLLRRLPGWLRTFLLMVAWAGLATEGVVRAWGGIGVGFVLLTGDRIDRPLEYGLTIVKPILQGIWFAVPAWVAIRGLRDHDRHRPTWLEYACLSIAFVYFVLAETGETARQVYSWGKPLAWLPDVLLRWLGLLMAVALAWPMAGWLGRRWGSASDPVHGSA